MALLYIRLLAAPDEDTCQEHRQHTSAHVSAAYGLQLMRQASEWQIPILIDCKQAVSHALIYVPKDVPQHMTACDLHQPKHEEL